MTLVDGSPNLWGPPMTLQGVLAAGGSLAGSLMTPSL